MLRGIYIPEQRKKTWQLPVLYKTLQSFTPKYKSRNPNEDRPTVHESAWKETNSCWNEFKLYQERRLYTVVHVITHSKLKHRLAIKLVCTSISGITDHGNRQQGPAAARGKMTEYYNIVAKKERKKTRHLHVQRLRRKIWNWIRQVFLTLLKMWVWTEDPYKYAAGPYFSSYTTPLVCCSFGKTCKNTMECKADVCNNNSVIHCITKTAIFISAKQTYTDLRLKH